jgi:Tfp pilus assembly protein PilF
MKLGIEKEPKVALIYRLALTIGYLKKEDSKAALNELERLIYEVEEDFIIPF